MPRLLGLGELAGYNLPEEHPGSFPMQAPPHGGIARMSSFGMSHRFGQIHVFAAATLSMVSRVMTFSSRAAEGDGGLDGGAGNIAGTESDFLIDDS